MEHQNNYGKQRGYFIDLISKSDANARIFDELFPLAINIHFTGHKNKQIELCSWLN